jgi:hypothetical protein
MKVRHGRIRVTPLEIEFGNSPLQEWSDEMHFVLSSSRQRRADAMNSRSSS